MLLPHYMTLNSEVRTIAYLKQLIEISNQFHVVHDRRYFSSAFYLLSLLRYYYIFSHHHSFTASVLFVGIIFAGITLSNIW